MHTPGEAERPLFRVVWWLSAEWELVVSDLAWLGRPALLKPQPRRATCSTPFSKYRKNILQRAVILSPLQLLIVRVLRRNREMLAYAVDRRAGHVTGATRYLAELRADSYRITGTSEIGSYP